MRGETTWKVEREKMKKVCSEPSKTPKPTEKHTHSQPFSAVRKPSETFGVRSTKNILTTPPIPPNKRG